MFQALYEKSKTEDLGLSERLFPSAKSGAITFRIGRI